MASGNDCPYHHSSTFRLFPRSGTFFNGARDSEGFRINNILSRSHSSLLENRSSSGCTVVRNKVQPVSSGAANSKQSSMDSSASTNSMNSRDFFLFGGAGSSTSFNSPCKSIPNSPTGRKFKLVHEGDIHICLLNHTRTVISKILSSKFLRRWETHHVYLSPTEIYSRTASGFMEDVIPYTHIEDVYIVTRWDATQKYCVRVVLPDGSVLLQVNNAYVRDQWLHSILWKKNMLRYRKLLANTRRPEVLTKELKGLAELSLTTPLQDDCILQLPLEIISNLLQDGLRWIPKYLNEDMISSICPLLELTTPTAAICDYFSTYCQENPRSRVITEMFTPVVQRILKHNMDFGKYPRTRVFVQVYAEALNYQNDGRNVLEKFINNIHGVSSTCPHPRVLPNLVSVCLAAVYSLYEERRNFTIENGNNIQQLRTDWESRLLCFTAMMEILSTFEDWCPSLSQLLQPIPFPDDALAHSFFTSSLKPVITNIVCDYRCDVHLMVLGVREEKEGWLLLYCPGGIACDDDGDLWSKMLQQLLSCCCRRKRFLETLNKSIGPCMLRALRDDEVLQSALCSMLELEVVENKDLQLQLITTLQSTASGRKHYGALCQRQQHLRELQQKGGPRKLTLPSRSTDSDVSRLLSHGSFGNLECLSLAFTQVTSACAEQLIKLPSLRYLNLWSTQFGDTGLQLISDHLHKLQVLNLCETPVTDKGLLYLAAIKNLKKLNLNSTNLSVQTFENLKKLPALQECDIRYTDAW